MRSLTRALATVALTSTTAALLVGVASPARAADCPNQTGTTGNYLCVQTTGPATQVPVVGGQTVTVGGQTVAPVVLAPSQTVGPIVVQEQKVTVPAVPLPLTDVCVLGTCMPLSGTKETTVTVLPTTTVVGQAITTPTVSTPAVAVPTVSQQVPATVPVVVPTVTVQSETLPVVVDAVNKALADTGAAVNGALATAYGNVTFVLNTAGELVGFVTATANGAVATVVTTAGQLQDTVFRAVADAQAEAARQLDDAWRTLDETQREIGRQLDAAVKAANDAVDYVVSTGVALAGYAYDEAMKKVAEAEAAVEYVKGQADYLVGVAQETAEGVQREVMRIIDELPTAQELVDTVRGVLNEVYYACSTTTGFNCRNTKGLPNEVAKFLTDTVCAQAYDVCADPVAYAQERLEDVRRIIRDFCDRNCSASLAEILDSIGTVDCGDVCATVQQTIDQQLVVICRRVQCDSISTD